MADKTLEEKIIEQDKKIAQLKSQIHHQFSDINSLRYAQAVQHYLWDINRGSKTSLASFTSYTKANILQWLDSPETNEVSLRNASIQKYNTSTQYQRLINYFGNLLTWSYTLSPTKLDTENANPEELKKSYHKTLSTVENWNLRHELTKATIVALREDVFYGIEDSNKDSFHLIRMNPDYCVLTDIVDGCYRFAVDMSKIKAEEIVLYPQIIQDLYDTYVNTGVKYQLVPENLCWCFKFNETVEYPIPPFVSTLVDLCDIDDYKSLQLAKTEIQNYKALAMKVPTDTDGVPLIEWDDVQLYYTQISNVLPDYVGLIATPMDIDEFNFEKSGGLNDVDTVSRATEQFWNSTGTSGLLFGDASNNSAGALKLSIRADEELMFGFMAQVERVINRKLKYLSGKIKYKVNILPITRFNYEDMVGLYTDAISHGYPLKRAANAVLGLTPDDFNSQTYFENTVLDITSEFIPVDTSYTKSASSSDKAGRPPTGDTDAGEITEANSSNENR